jgi:hypothetical protein
VRLFPIASVSLVHAQVNRDDGVIRCGLPDRTMVWLVISTTTTYINHDGKY